jgi:plastocyanin
MRPVVAGLSLSLLLTLGLTACGSHGSTACGSYGSTGTCLAPMGVEIGQDTFITRSQVVLPGKSTPFVNKASVGYTVCLGWDGRCDPYAHGPKDITAPGFYLGPGATRLITFDQRGTYDITCAGHPQMNMILHV